MYLEYINTIDTNLYYYFRKPVFPGDLAKELIQKSMISLKFKKNLGIDLVPTLLSVWSGVKCPVEYNQIVDDKKYKEVIDYVTKLSNFNWEVGKKYFYGNILD
ncbi:hypothetical protein K4569_01805 [Bacillus bingmayongensis]|nr:hypothetical protein [Bacillus bingmayongensis]